MDGFIYFRSHDSYDVYNAFKMGMTDNLLNRENTYITGEIKKGFYVKAFKVNLKEMKPIEKLLQNEFKENNIYIDGGKEFYDKCIISKIEPFLIKMNLNYAILNEEDIKKVIRKKKVIQSLKKINKIELINTILNLSLKPRNFQLEIIDTMHEHLKTKNKGMLVLPCGSGKTLTSLWISLKLNAQSILIGIPSILLLKQWFEDVKKLFKINILCVYNSINTTQIKTFLLNNLKCIILTTYASSGKVLKASKDINFTFDVKILDEAHHLTNTINENINSFIKILNIQSLKQISLTATIKTLEDVKNDNVVSNDNINYFGEIVVQKCLLWGIKLNIVCDYVIKMITLKNEEIQHITPQNIDEYDKKLFLSAITALQSLNEKAAHHILIYANTRENSKKICNYIKFLINKKYFNVENFYYSNYDSFMKESDKTKILSEYNNHANSIISCVYCLSEGYDNPLIDEVIVSENMSSNIRIVQALLRAGRKNKNEPNKITKILLPILYDENWLNDNANTDLLKVKQILQKIGIEDETITEKIKLCKINIKKKNKMNEITKNDVIECESFNNFVELNTLRRDEIKLSYEQAKKILTKKNIKTKLEYLNLCETDNRFHKKPENYFENFNWIRYLEIPKIYYDIETCKNKIEKYLNLDNERIKYSYDVILLKMCELDKNFPPFELWLDYYEINDLSELMQLKNIKKPVKIMGI